MSVESIAVVLHHSRATGTALAVMIGIANHDGDGGAWPSMATLAKYGRCTVRNAQKSVAKLEALGEIRRDVQRGGLAASDPATRPNLYHVLLRCPADCDGTKNHRSRPVSNPEPDPPSAATPPVGSDTRPPVGSDTLTVHLTNHEDTHTHVTTVTPRRPVDKSECWNKWSAAFVHARPPGSQPGQTVECARCGEPYEPLPPVRLLHADRGRS